MAHSSRTAVLTAICANGIVTVIKFFAAMAGGSASMMNEAVHSLMDTLNQAFLLFGLIHADKPADEQYAFGHGQKKYLWNLWSAIGLFSIGCGLGLAHAWHSYHSPASEAATDTVILGLSLSPLVLSLSVLFIAFILEGYSFLVALKEFLQRMKADKHQGAFSYLLKCEDATLVAVVLEDSVAMLGLLMAAIGISLSALTGNPFWDILFSAAIATMLGCIAFYLGYINMRFLTDMRDIKAEQLLSQVVAQHPEIDRHHDLRSIILDEQTTILVAEIELREEAIVSGLHARLEQEREKLAQHIPDDKKQDAALAEYIDARAAVQVTLERTEEIIRELEMTIRDSLPRVSHITIEVKGITDAK
ncbi:cation diffusion facilitator family transporter [Amphritea sp. HPY]|uniref:cation diffusion facilitator family transporter n=1 Tax=Amphritea sp. HPY TaxID=3421652 RepID=UPI003D7E7372